MIDTKRAGWNSKRRKCQHYDCVNKPQWLVRAPAREDRELCEQHAIVARVLDLAVLVSLKKEKL